MIYYYSSICDNKHYYYSRHDRNDYCIDTYLHIDEQDKEFEYKVELINDSNSYKILDILSVSNIKYNKYKIGDIIYINDNLQISDSIDTELNTNNVHFLHKKEMCCDYDNAIHSLKISWSDYENYKIKLMKPVEMDYNILTIEYDSDNDDFYISKYISYPHFNKNNIIYNFNDKFGLKIDNKFVEFNKIIKFNKTDEYFNEKDICKKILLYFINEKISS